MEHRAHRIAADVAQPIADGLELRERWAGRGLRRRAVWRQPRRFDRIPVRGEVDPPHPAHGNGFGGGGVRVHDAYVHPWRHPLQRREDSAARSSRNHRGGRSGQGARAAGDCRVQECGSPADGSGCVQEPRPQGDPNEGARVVRHPIEQAPSERVLQAQEDGGRLLQHHGGKCRVLDRRCRASCEEPYATPCHATPNHTPEFADPSSPLLPRARLHSNAEPT